MVPDSSK
jgi:hypothetical protein